jgi:hypothetical protein
MDITEVTRRNIFDELSVAKVDWSGRLCEDDFLSRMYDLSELPSFDYRFSTAATDIWQHRVRNRDWEHDWVFTDQRFDLLHGTDENFLRFLCEMLNPVVREDPEEVNNLLSMFNKHLRRDGWELHEQTSMSGRPVFAGRRLLVGADQAVESVKGVAATLNSAYMSGQVTRLEVALKGDPELVIGTAKEFVESVCKTILDDHGVMADPAWDLPRLVRETMNKLTILPRQVDAAIEGGRTLRSVLQNLASVVQGLAELRNNYGTGHGKHAGAVGLGLPHARLAVHAATGLAVFLFETWEAAALPAHDGHIPV